MEENTLSMTQTDEMIMKLLHYFVTVENYSPIVLKGAKNEIWLEKFDGEYKIVRLVSNYIHNNEQLNMDIYRTKQIMKRIKKKTMSFSINALSIFVNLGDNVELDTVSEDNIDCANIKTTEDLKKYQFIMDEFPTITKKTNFKEEGLDLFVKLTNDIGEVNKINQKQAEDLFAKKDPIITKILITINIVIFILQLVLGWDVVANFGANYAPFVKSGKFYVLFTSMFIHGNLIHLLFNMYALYIIGPQVESFYGKIKYLAIYFGSGILGALLSDIFLQNSISVGASGAIFGLLSSIVYFGYHYRAYLDTVIRSQIMPLIIFNIFLGIVIPNIDTFCHIGGLIGGVLVSMACGIKYKSSKSERINGFILTTIYTIFLLILLFK
ncbi:MAG: rhomboid family intramembrane serine protease [Tenericutes bacterium]|nr:rhomboid family intramembrane serine protease [Mycoplasmatota bacterium]MDY3801881.1 rhomboid family intramembrane serine protease [Bacilli bacterium]